MPFTPSHAALALPFLRTPLLPSAVVIGTVTPDLPYFLPLPTFRGVTHEFAGVPTIDLGIALVAFLLWIAFRAPIIDLSPTWLRTRVVLRSWRAGRSWPNAIVLLVVSLIVGILTHLIWDGFTHPGWVVDHVPVLGTQLGPLPLEKWLQHASSIAGLVALAIWAAVWVRRTPERADVASAPVRLRTAAWLAAATVFIGSGLVAWVSGIHSGTEPFDPVLVFVVARISVGATLASVLVACLLWRARYRDRRTATTLPNTSA